MDEREPNRNERNLETQVAENRHDLQNLRQIVDIKLEQLGKDISELKNILKWAGGLIISLMISFMGWALLQQYNTNEQSKKDLQQQVDILRAQESGNKDRNDLRSQVEQLQAGAAQPAAPPSRSR